MARIIIVYSTTDGHTIEICERLRRVLEQASHQVEVKPLAENPDLDPGAWDRIVIGASIRYGKHKPEVTTFINRNQARLESMPSAFFSVNAVARKPEKRTPETNPYVRKFLKGIRWKPARMAVFAGKIDYPRYGFFDRNMIRFIMWITKGPTDPRGTFEFTDWEAVEAFGRALSAS